MKQFTHYTQPDSRDCGPTCLRMVAKHYGRSFSLPYLREKSYITRHGVSMLGISDAAEAIGFKTLGVKISFEQLEEEAPLPAIVHWKQNHFVVVYEITKKGMVHVADPAHGLVKYTKEEFLKYWISTTGDGESKGIALLLETTPAFFEMKGEKSDRAKFSFLFKYLTPHKKYIIQLFLGMLLGSLLQLIFPFLTQSVVDVGIGNQNLGFITLVLIAQLVLAAARMSVDFIRNWILLHISTRINISLISDFLIKLMKLPIGFFRQQAYWRYHAAHWRPHPNSEFSNWFIVVNAIQYGEFACVRGCFGMVRFEYSWNFSAWQHFVCFMDFAIYEKTPRTRF